MSPVDYQRILKSHKNPKATSKPSSDEQNGEQVPEDEGADTTKVLADKQERNQQEISASESQAEKKDKPRIALALGSGSARGWAHIGVLKALKDEGIPADAICGSSIGAIVGAAYAHDRLDDLESWALGLTRWRLFRFLDLTFSQGAIVHANKIRDELSEVIADSQVNIEDLTLPFIAVATNMSTGREIRFTKGSLHEAILSSTAIPGLMPPVWCQNKWIIDGGVVNPVPVNVCRNFEADHIIAVNLNGGIIKPKRAEVDLAELLNSKNGQPSSPGMFDTLAGAINIMQDNITRSRMVGDPPDILISPRLNDIAMMDFDSAEKTIALGYEAVERSIGDIRHVLGQPSENSFEEI